MVGGPMRTTTKPAKRSKSDKGNATKKAARPYGAFTPHTHGARIMVARVKALGMTLSAFQAALKVSQGQAWRWLNYPQPFPRSRVGELATVLKVAPGSPEYQELDQAIARDHALEKSDAADYVEAQTATITALRLELAAIRQAVADCDQCSAVLAALDRRNAPRRV